jgi:hypothetical protein
MTPSDIDLLKAIWFQLAEDDFSNEKLSEQVLHDGGNDMSNLSRLDVTALIEGRFSGDWHKPAFSFSEFLAYYRACGEELTSHQVVGWVFASFVIADAIEHDAAEWERQFENFITGFVTVKERLQIDQSVQILRRVFCRPQELLAEKVPVEQ